jgi:hypothetical protein
VVDADEVSYTVDRLLRMKADHEAHSSALPTEAAREFEVALDQSMNVNGQSGGFAAHTVNAETINVNSPPASTLVEARTMQAIEAVWNVMLQIEDAFRVVAFVDSILTLEELEAGFANGNSREPFTALRKFATSQSITDALERAGTEAVQRERPYLNRRLYIIFFAFQAVVGRCAMLVHYSFENRSFQSWRDDTGVKAHLESVLPKEWLEQLHQQRHYALYYLIDALKEAFLAEAERQRRSLRRV